jgi:hypothetical protein
VSYGTGKFPAEAASKVAHMKLLQNATVTALVTQFEATDPNLDPPVGERTGTVDLSVDPAITHVVTTDGGEVVVPNPFRREKAVGFVNVATTVFSLEELATLRSEFWLDPREEARIIRESQHLTPAVLPLAGVSLPNLSVKQSIRMMVHHALEYSGLYPTLDFLVSRGWDSSYQMPGPDSPAMLCRGCRREFPLPRSARAFACPACRHGHTLSDYLGIGEDSSDDWGRADSVKQLRDVIETLSMFSVVRGLYEHPESLSKVLFVKDGPLLLRAYLYRLADAIRAFVAWLKQRGATLKLVGIEKHGELVDHVEFIKQHLPNAGDFFLPTVEYVVREIKGAEFPSDPAEYRNRVSYGAKLVARVGPDHILALNVPTGEFMLEPTPEDLLGLGDILRGLSRLVSYRYPNALMTVVATNAAASLSFNPSGRILDQFIDSMLAGRRRGERSVP